MSRCYACVYGIGGTTGVSDQGEKERERESNAGNAQDDKSRKDQND
jgi:hypothetical protein